MGRSRGMHTRDYSMTKTHLSGPRKRTSYFARIFFGSIFLSFLFNNYESISGEKINVLVSAAKNQVGKTVRYNPQYQKMAYPLGDVPLEEGVCTDVIIRAFRELGMDLQKLVHEDMKKNWSSYPKKWGLKGTDSNIDHRRVPNLMTYFNRQKMAITTGEYKPGDIIVWDLGGGILHIGLLSDKTVKLLNNEEYPLVFHNIARGVHEEDILKTFKIVGHYRLKG